MNVADRSGHSLLALAAAMAALITGIVDGSPAWYAASAVLLVIWAVLCIFAVFPAVYTRSIKWLEKKYEATLPVPVDPPSNIPKAPRNTNTDETTALKITIRELVTTLEC